MKQLTNIKNIKYTSAYVDGFLTNMYFSGRKDLDKKTELEEKLIITQSLFYDKKVGRMVRQDLYLNQQQHSGKRKIRREQR